MVYDELISNKGTDQFQFLKDGNPVVYFKNYDDFIHRLRVVEPSCKTLEQGASSQKKADSTWYGTPNWEKSLELADTGWREMTPKLITAVEKVQDEVFRLLPHLDVTRDYVGECFDMGEYMSGEPEYWRKWSHVGQEKPTVFITMNAAVSCSVDTKTIIQRGSAMISLCGALELLGYPVQITVIHYVTHSGKYRAHAKVLPVKMPGEVIDYPRVAYAMAHPSLLRRSFFRIYEWPKFYSALGVGAGYGYPSDPPKEILNELLDSPKHSIYFGSIRYGEENHEFIEKHGEVAWVLREVKKVFGEGSNVEL